ncbi:MAG: glutathione S-transferase family protein [Gammaproteobacteria bacterium]
MLKIHHLNNSRSQRVVWLGEELNIEYELVKHMRDSETLRSPQSLYDVHPLGKAPVVEHAGHTIFETDAIMEYICNVCANGQLSRQKDADDYGEYLAWLAYSEGTLFPGLGMDLLYAWTGGGNEDLKGFYDVELEKNLKYLQDSLGGRDSILESGFSAADINLGWTLEFAECRGRLKPYPGLQIYLDALRARDAYKRSLEKGGPQDLSVFAAGVE